MEIKVAEEAGIHAVSDAIGEGGTQIKTVGFDEPDAGSVEDSMKKSLDPQSRQMYAQLPRAAQKRVLKVYEREMAKLDASGSDGVSVSSLSEQLGNSGKEFGSENTVPGYHSAGNATKNGRKVATGTTSAKAVKTVYSENAKEALWNKDSLRESYVAGGHAGKPDRQKEMVHSVSMPLFSNGPTADSLVVTDTIHKAGTQSADVAGRMAQKSGSAVKAGDVGYGDESAESTTDYAQETVRQGIDTETQAIRTVSNKAQNLAKKLQSGIEEKREAAESAVRMQEPQLQMQENAVVTIRSITQENRTVKSGKYAINSSGEKCAGKDIGRASATAAKQFVPKKANSVISAGTADAATKTAQNAAKVAAKAATEATKTGVEAASAVSTGGASAAAESGTKSAEVAARAGETVAKIGKTAAHTASESTAKAGEMAAQTAAKTAEKAAVTAVETSVKAAEISSTAATAATTGGVSLAAEAATEAVKVPVKIAEKVRAEIIRQHAAAELSLEAGSRLQGTSVGESADNGKREEKKGGIAMLVGVVMVILLVIPLAILPVFISAITGNSDEYIAEAAEEVQGYGEALVEAAEYELSRGGFGGSDYISWYNSYGYEISGSWCGMFISYCGYQCGYVGDGVSGSMPYLASCARMKDWYEARGWYFDAEDYIPSAGDIIFYTSGHAGIVCSYDESTQMLRTIEGNIERADIGSGVTIKAASYRYIHSASIEGYACPALSVLE